MSPHSARWWHPLDDGRIQCDLFPRDCKLHEGQRGMCFVRQRVGDAMRLTTYGRSSGFCVDPIEKKPLNHFFPGSRVFSFGTAGCNLACKFCQNWDISKSREMDRLTDAASRERIAEAARASGALSVAFTYNDPVIFAEYAMDAVLLASEPTPRLNSTSPTLPGVTRSWNSVADFVQEVSNARIYDGVRYRNSTEVGSALGRKVGELAVAKLMN